MSNAPLIPLSKAARMIRGEDVTPHGAYQWAWSAVRSGHLPHVKIGSRYFMTQQQIDAVLSGNFKTPVSSDADAPANA